MKSFLPSRISHLRSFLVFVLLQSLSITAPARLSPKGDFNAAINTPHFDAASVSCEQRTFFCTPPTFLNNGQIVLDASKCKNDGSIYIIPTSGTPPFLYSIDGGRTYVPGPDAGYSFENLFAGTYYLRLKDATGCESEVVTREVKVAFDCPQCIALAFRNTSQFVSDGSCNGGAGSISIFPTGGAPPFAYSIDGGATYVAGPNDGYTFQSLGFGVYNLRLKDANGCQSAVVKRLVKGNIFRSCATKNAINLPLRSVAAVGKEEIRAYPNPSRGHFQVQLSHYGSQKVQVQILDQRGSVLQNKMVSPNETSVLDIDMQGKASGLYLVRVVSNKGIQVQKVQVQ